MAEEKQTPAALRALIVEDEGLMVLVLRRALTASGCQVVGSVSSGVEAVEQARALTPDVILMDINLPEMNGIEATRRILSERPVPIVMLTAYSEQSLVEEAIEAGACAYLVKPILSEQVAPAVRAAVARFEALDRVQRENEDLRDALETRKLVERAKGILMERQRLSEADAFRRIQKLARDRSQTMRQVAQEILHADQLLR